MASGEVDKYGMKILCRGEYSIGMACLLYSTWAAGIILGLIFLPLILLIPFCYTAHKKRWYLHLTSKGLYYCNPSTTLPWLTDQEHGIKFNIIHSITKPCGGGLINVFIKPEHQTERRRGWRCNEVIEIGPIENPEEFIQAFESERSRQRQELL